MAAKPMTIPTEVQTLMAALGIAIPENPQDAAKLIAALGQAAKATAKANKTEKHELTFASKAVKSEDGTESVVDVARLSTGRKGKPCEVSREQAGIVTTAAADFDRFLKMDFGAIVPEVVVGDKSFSLAELRIMRRQGDALSLFAEGAEFADCEAARVDPPQDGDGETTETPEEE